MKRTDSQNTAFLLMDVCAGHHLEDLVIELIEELRELLLRHLAELRLGIVVQLPCRPDLNVHIAGLQPRNELRHLVRHGYVHETSHSRYLS